MSFVSEQWDIIGYILNEFRDISGKEGSMIISRHWLIEVSILDEVTPIGKKKLDELYEIECALLYYECN